MEVPVIIFKAVSHDFAKIMKNWSQWEKKDQPIERFNDNSWIEKQI